jgi:hypothetical protein
MAAGCAATEPGRQARGPAGDGNVICAQQSCLGILLLEAVIMFLLGEYLDEQRVTGK